MTTFQYTLTLDDSEMIALTYAIDFYMAECIKQKKAAAGAPYWAHLDSLEEIKARRHKNARQMSGNTFSKSYGWDEEFSKLNDTVQYDKDGNPT